MYIALKKKEKKILKFLSYGNWFLKLKYRYTIFTTPLFQNQLGISLLLLLEVRTTQK